MNHISLYVLCVHALFAYSSIRYCREGSVITRCARAAVRPTAGNNVCHVQVRHSHCSVCIYVCVRGRAPYIMYDKYCLFHLFVLHIVT